MAKKVFEEEFIANIADAIRRTGYPEHYFTKYTTEEMEAAIVQNSCKYQKEVGFSDGYKEGHRVGLSEGSTDGFTEGYKQGEASIPDGDEVEY